MSDDPQMGDLLTITFDALDRGRMVTVRARVVTVDDVLDAVEDAMRGAGFKIRGLQEIEERRHHER